ncbi:MAG: DUF3150 domain-containing protein [Syntrophales bacterium]
MNTMNNTLNILDNVQVLTLDIHVWSGRKKLRPEDLKLMEGSELPPESLAKLGSKLVMDPEKLAVFMAIRQSAAREALFVGTRFLGGYAIPVDKVADLMVKLDGLKIEFEAKKEEFLASYSEAVQSWIDANPGWESVIANAQAEPEHVRKSLCFSTQVFNVTPVEKHQEGLQKEVTGLAGQLRHEIQVMAKDTWKRSYHGQQEVTQKALRPIHAMIRKIEGLVFLEPELNDLVEGIKETLAGMPPKGAIKGRQLAEACGILAILGDIPEAMRPAVLTDEDKATVDGTLFQQEAEQEAPAPESESEALQEIIAPAFSKKPFEAASPAEWF